MRWLEVTVNARHDEIEDLTARLSAAGIDSLITEDEEDILSFLEENRKYWDYVDDSFLASMKGVCRIKFYLEDSPEGRGSLQSLHEALPERELIVNSAADEDWENNWKEFYKPINVGEKILICPQWEKEPETDREIILKLDPGLIFGTGSHATTRMCLESLEKYAKQGARVLDLGCGSGILSIAALLLGASSAVGCDIDPKAPRVAMSNAELNGINSERFTVFCGDVLTSLRVEGKFDIVLANIVADVIIALAERAKGFLGDSGVFIASGIIDGREKETASALESAGFRIIERKSADGWNAFVCG